MGARKRGVGGEKCWRKGGEDACVGEEKVG